ncbi:transcriptional repressor NrdR [Bradymonadaceae bacterium TMQ3]|uniref:Transcriptional repressor NrdR n=1 Tax=Lujinxingia sediminis TaxID=2480984 RepID=A0ABY0CW53_9DELT|nr:transcriptional regulator NrdR [Lujinxingia sediminis]RDV39843.1 transcriptional repressor NrdR [Bradymonadaceae bacterium TMQ3]RVU48113.1 transcriptional repressor NrdR [Lujinxingia sediminis]TXC77412.1 transcriptional repressor NrdR [Bradymonadales bacterium TMQ1]
MRCPFCGHLEDRVVDSRQARGGSAIRRRRECLQCERRYTTYEQIEEAFPQVVKRDETREEYDRQKIERGIRLACSKRPISVAQIEDVVDRFEEHMLELGAREVTSDWIGSTITTELRDLDPVAYIRFASVYRAFNNIDEFLDELRELDRFERDRHPSPPAGEPDEPATKD